MKEVNCCIDVAGEDFSAAIEDGCKHEKNTSGPYHRSLPYIDDRKKRVLDGGRGNFRDYDEVDAVTQS